MKGIKIILSSGVVVAIAATTLAFTNQPTKPKDNDNQRLPVKKVAICCESNIPKRFASLAADNHMINAPVLKSHKGMVWINGGSYAMGADNNQAADDEYPKHRVTVKGFWIDATEVTNNQFEQFVKATGYLTTAERKPDWNELKKQLPPRNAKTRRRFTGTSIAGF